LGKHTEPVPEQWKHRIEPFSWKRGEGASWERATDADADTWFLFGDKGDDRRVFGVFTSRLRAEDTVRRLVRGDMGKQFKGMFVDGLNSGLQAYIQTAAERFEEAPATTDKGIDR
jgi:hypothetical protein